MYLVLTLSLNLINGCGGMFSLGHQGFWALGAYGAAALIVKTSLTEHLPDAAVFALSFVAGAIVAGAAGFLIALPCLRLRGDYLAVATLGFAEIIRNLLISFDSFLGGSRGQQIPALIVANSPATELRFFGLYLTTAALLVAMAIWICRNVIHSSHGRAILAVREDEIAAELLGVNVTRYKLLVFVLGATLAGVAGALQANFEGYIAPQNYGMMEGIMVLLMVVLGGTGSMSGTILATILLYSLQVVLQAELYGWPVYFAELTGADSLIDFARSMQDTARLRWQFVFAVLLVIVMIAMPNGIFGKREIWQTAWFRRLAGMFGVRPRHAAGSAA
jgi:branched-chain amino acid transport system permease protein